MTKAPWQGGDVFIGLYRDDLTELPGFEGGAQVYHMLGIA